MSHFNIQIHIQQVTEPEKLLDTSGYPVKVSGREVMKERQVVEVLKLAVTADTERAAYAKAHKLLTANEPEWTTEAVSRGE